MTSDTAVVFLGVIAVAALLIAAAQLGIAVFVLRATRRLEAVVDKVEHEIKPMVANLTEVSQNAVRASSLAAAQVERVDRLFADFARRVDETFTLVQTAIVGPAREGRAVVTAVRAAVAAFREMRARRRGRAEDEDALFIG